MREMIITTATMTSVRRRVGQVVGNMTRDEALAALAEIRAAGITIFQPAVQKITGGFNSQEINGYVIRKLGVKTGIIRNAK